MYHPPVRMIFLTQVWWTCPTWLQVVANSWVGAVPVPGLLLLPGIHIAVSGCPLNTLTALTPDLGMDKTYNILPTPPLHNLSFVRWN